jgi:hypothetical protein
MDEIPRIMDEVEAELERRIQLVRAMTTSGISHLLMWACSERHVCAD